MKKKLLGLAFAAAMFSVEWANAETTICTNITVLPFTITSQGVYCLKQNLVTGISSGNAITINANNVTIDFNNFKLGGASAGPATTARGIYALDRKNVTLKNANIRGFRYGAFFQQLSGTSSGHQIVDSLFDGNTEHAILVVGGSGMTIRNNRIVNTDSTPPPAPGEAAATTRTSAPLRTNSGISGYISQAGTGVGVSAILFSGVSESKITENDIVNTISSGSEAYAIVSNLSSNNLEISGNSIANTIANTFSAGILIGGGANFIVRDNNLIDGKSNTETAIGIEVVGGASIVICLDNAVIDFPTIQTIGCAVDSGTIP